MKKIAAVICLMSILVPSSSFAYSRSSQGYSNVDSQEAEWQTTEGSKERSAEEAQRELEGKSEHQPPRAPEGELESRMSTTAILGYVMITVGGLAAIGGSTILATTSKRTLGASIAAGGAAVGLAGSMMLMFGQRRTYGVSPAIDPESGTYGVVLAKRF